MQPPRLSPGALAELSRITPGRTPLRAVVELGVIASVVALLEHAPVAVAIAAWPLAALLIASRQHALLVLMHECAHFRATRLRWLNDVLGELIGWTFLMSMRGYRRHHRRHHVGPHLNTLEDPDWARLHRDGWRFPMARRELAKQLVRDVLLLNTPELLREARDAKNGAVESRADAVWLVARVLALLGLAAALVAFGGVRLYAVYWLLPSLGFLKAILRLRAIVDHFGLPERGELEATRTVLAPWWERLVLAPCDIGVHHVHHAYASVPHYRLRAAHHALAELPGYRDRVRISKSYLRALLDECCPVEVRS